MSQAGAAPQEGSVRDRLEASADGLVVPKGQIRGGWLAKLPAFVAENLVGKMGLHDAVGAVEQYFPAAETREALRYALVRQGHLTILDQLAARVDMHKGRLYGNLANFSNDRVDISPDLVDEFPELLASGLWGRVRLRHRPARTRGEPPVSVVSFAPVSTQAKLDKFLEIRREFNVDEWMDVLLHSLGYDPQAWAGLTNPKRVKWLILARLIPLVEPQFNLIELGPKNTGKTYTYRNISAGTFVVSGGMTTPANLFVNLRNGQVGILGNTKCVVFDEVAGLAIQDAYGTTSILKDYMESGHYSRGNRDYVADASLVFLGNLTTEAGQPAPYYTHFLRDLPAVLLDTAVIDRLHAFLPGWEIPKITPRTLDSEWGLSIDYLGAILDAMRSHSMTDAVTALLTRYPYRPGVTQRDRRALDKIVSALLKILFPHAVPDDAEAQELLAFAAELRQRVHNQLCHLAPGEFAAKTIGYEFVEGSSAADFTRGIAWTTHDQRLNGAPRPGEVTALLARVDDNGEAVDGDVQVVEASLISGSGGLQLNGFHGRAMKESANAAYHYLAEHLNDFFLPPDALRGSTLVVHLVSVARPREGPSAGLAFLVAMVSAVTERPVRPALAVTGEVTLHGEIEPVGGLLPKLTAAYRRGRRTVLVPEANRGEMVDLQRLFGDQLDVRLVGTVQEALQEAFGLSSH